MKKLDLKNYEYYFEQVHNTNKETKLDEHQKQVQYYNANKDRFDNIFLKSEDKWEEEAKEIIDGNVYLAHRWRIAKIEHEQKELDEKSSDAELTSDEKNDIQSKINELNTQIQNELRNIDKKISEDLAEINSL